MTRAPNRLVPLVLVASAVLFYARMTRFYIVPFLAYTFHDREDLRFNAPTLVLISQWFVSHRYRTGQEVNQGIPWVALAFQFKGIL